MSSSLARLAPGMRYIVREHKLSLSREIIIEDRDGERLYRLHGPLVRARDELRLDDSRGVALAQIKEPLLGDRRTYEIFRDGARWAQVQMLVVGNLLDGFDIQVTDGELLHARGDLLAHAYTLLAPAGVAAQIRRQGGAYEVETALRQDDVLLLASVVAISAMVDNWSHARNA